MKGEMLIKIAQNRNLHAETEGLYSTCVLRQFDQKENGEIEDGPGSAASKIQMEQ
jgi:hypothetical protein